MAMTQAQAITEVRSRIDEEDSTTGFVLDSQIRAWINEGVREVARRSLWKRTSGSVSVTAGTQYYTAASAAIQIYRLEFTPTGQTLKYRLEYADINAMDVVWGASQSQGRGIPDAYTLVSANPLSIQLHPIPNTNGALKVYYYAMPTDLVTSTTTDAATALDTPIGWEDLVVEYATGLAQRKARDIQAYQLTMTSFASSLSRLVEMATRYTDEATYIVNANYGADDWGW